MARVACSKCGKNFNVRDSSVKEIVLCPHCGQGMIPTKATDTGPVGPGTGGVKVPGTGPITGPATAGMKVPGTGAVKPATGAVRPATGAAKVPGTGPIPTAGKPGVAPFGGNEDIMAAMRRAAAKEDGKPVPTADQPPALNPQDERNVLDALRAAASYEEKVPTTSNQGFELDDPEAVPGPAGTGPATKPATRPTAIVVGPMANRQKQQPPQGYEVAPPELKYEETTPNADKKIAMIIVGSLVALLVIATIIVLATRKSPSSKDSGLASGASSGSTGSNLGVPPPPPPPPPAVAPDKPEMLSAFFKAYATNPSMVLDITCTNKTGSAAPFSVAPASARANRPVEMFDLKISDASGKQTKIAELPDLLQRTFFDSLRADLRERGINVLPSGAQPTDGGLVLRVALVFVPEWAIANATPQLNKAQDMELPKGMGISIARVDLVAGEHSIGLLQGPRDLREACDFSPPSSLVPRATALTITATSVTTIGGTISYSDFDLTTPAVSAAKWVSANVLSPDKDWQTIWGESSSPEQVRAALRGVLAADADEFVHIMATAMNAMTGTAKTALRVVLEDDATPTVQIRPFLSGPEPFRAAALKTLALRKDPTIREACSQALQNESTPSDILQACACAMIDMGENSSELDAALDADRITAFPWLRRPQRLLSRLTSVRDKALGWLLLNGSDYQKQAAAYVVKSANIDALSAQADDVIRSATVLNTSDLIDLCRVLNDLKFSDPWGVYEPLARRYLIKAGVGDEVVSPEIAGIGMLGQGGEQRIVDFFLAKLLAASPSRVGPFAAEIVGGPRSWTRLRAIEYIVDSRVDYVDAAPRLQALRLELDRNGPMGIIAMQEMQEYRDHLPNLRRFDNLLPAINSKIATGDLDGAQRILDDIKKEKPDCAVAKQAEKLINDARAKLGAASTPASVP